jgi:alkane 1-monooxygenase
MKWLLAHRFAVVALVTAVPLPVLGYLLGQNWLTLIVAFGALPLADWVVGPDRRNPTPADEARWACHRNGSTALYAYVPVQIGLIAWGAAVYAGGELSTTQSLGLMISVGVVTGGQGITIAHELGHRRSAVDRLLAKLLLTTVCYGHFHIEHNRGHHARVATPDDPATARLGESLYASCSAPSPAAWCRPGGSRPCGCAGVTRPASVFTTRCCGSPRCLHFWHWHSAWRSDCGRAVLRRPGSGRLLLLEAINYVEHYGLVRGVAGGTLERVTPRHSWNSSQSAQQRVSDQPAAPRRSPRRTPCARTHCCGITTPTARNCPRDTPAWC